MRDPFASRALVALGVLEVLDTTGSLVTLGDPPEGAVRRAREALASHAHAAVIAAVEPWLRLDAPSVLARTHIEATALAAVARQAQGDREAASELLRSAIVLSQLSTGSWRHCSFMGRRSRVCSSISPPSSGRTSGWRSS